MGSRYHQKYKQYKQSRINRNRVKAESMNKVTRFHASSVTCRGLLTSNPFSRKLKVQTAETTELASKRNARIKTNRNIANESGLLGQIIEPREDMYTGKNSQRR